MCFNKIFCLFFKLESDEIQISLCMFTFDNLRAVVCDVIFDLDGDELKRAISDEIFTFSFDRQTNHLRSWLEESNVLRK